MLSYLILLNRINFDDCPIIGKGAFGTIFKIVDPLDESTYALKQIPYQGQTPSGLVTDYIDFERITNEIEILKN